MHHRIRPIRSAAVALSTVALGAGVLAAPPASAEPTPALRAAKAAATTDSTPSTIAAEWVAGELSNGLMPGKAGPDFGLTIDTGLALSTVVSQGGTVTAINNSLEPRIGEYVGDGTKESYAGPLAKAATFARTAKKNPTSYGGRNLITELEARTDDAVKDGVPNPIAGRISDKSEFGDFANVVGQSYAVRALSLANSAEAGAARDFLLKQQCASGYFRLNFDKANVPSQSCTEGVAGSEADPDATALAVINLVESGDKSAAVQGALAKAGTWLAGRQRNSGAIRSAGPGASINTNSTALGGYALGLLKNRDAALKAALWVRKNQPVDKYKCRTALTKDTGAVAYRRDRVTAATTTGIPADARDEWRRATAQAILGLQFAPASKDKLRIVSVRRQARAGDRVQFRVFGLAPSESACMQVKGDFRRVKGKKSGAMIVRKLTLPTGNQRRVALVKTSDDEARTSLRVRN
ncbi:prenyltransferase/squalene oxidase repeat-containing protein [Nocardioides astragali]|uniref:Prenyltransferase/squalene oxidase repeat-containing protein n=1 Tax=Nocardioides astragali TaxID=1776736 RepID=A0ABW2N4M9_9ACTN|nr:prenyltransferase/squalene oxidase repeat-containing protein [Nocardioides astragali]